MSNWRYENDRHMHSIFIKFLFSPWEFRSQKCHINICFSFMLLPFARINVRAAGKTPRCDDIQMENNAIGRCVRMLALQLSYSAYIFTFIISIKFVFCWQMENKTNTHMVEFAYCCCRQLFSFTAHSYHFRCDTICITVIIIIITRRGGGGEPYIVFCRNSASCSFQESDVGRSEKVSINVIV